MIVGHKTQWDFLKRLVEEEIIPQALLFTGEESLGKKKVALEFVKLLQGREIRYPDLIIIEPQGKEIQISQIRDLQHSLSLRPQMSSFKSVIIDNAQTLNFQAQSCLLKTLEEPKGKVLFLLVTAYPEMLLETIRSRCEILKFYPVSDEEMRKYFSDKFPQSKFEDILKISNGKPGKVISFLENPQKFNKTLELFGDIQELLDSDFSQRFVFIKKFFEATKNSKLPLNSFLEIFERYLRILLLDKLGIKKEFSNIFAKKISNNYSVSVIKKMIESVENLRFLIFSTNVNQKLALENLMLNICPRRQGEAVA